MKLSDNTITILKNFAGINQSLQFKQGSVLKTIHQGKTIFAEATVEETFPRDFAIYDVTKLLAINSLYNDAELSFEENQVTFTTSSDEVGSTKYCSPELLTHPPAKEIKLPQVDCSFDVSRELLEWMRKAAGISQLPNFVFESDGSVVTFIATDVQNDACDQYKKKLGAGDGKKFRVTMKVEHFKLIDGDYEVSISKRGLARFKNKTVPVTYYLAVEADSSNFEDGEE